MEKGEHILAVVWPLGFFVVTKVNWHAERFLQNYRGNIRTSITYDNKKAINLIWSRNKLCFKTANTFNFVSFH